MIFYFKDILFHKYTTSPGKDIENNILESWEVVEQDTTN